MTLCKFEILGIDNIGYDYISKLHHNIFEDVSSNNLFLAGQLLFPRAAKVSYLKRMVILGGFIVKMVQSKISRSPVSLSYPVTDSIMSKWIGLAQKEHFSFSDESKEGLSFHSVYYPDTGKFHDKVYKRKQVLSYDEQDLPTLKGIDVGDVVYREYIYCIVR